MYIGDHKIKSEKLTGKYIEVDLGEKKITLSPEVLDSVKTKKKTDLTKLRELSCLPVVKDLCDILSLPMDDDGKAEVARKVLDLFLKHNVNYNNVDHIVQYAASQFTAIVNFILNSVEMGKKKAVSKVWGSEEKTFLEAENILKS